MPSGAITSYIDVAQLALYAFWIFFAGLILYLRNEDRREGYPLMAEGGKTQGVLLGGIPKPKSFMLPHGGVSLAPHPEDYDVPTAATATGYPMLDGVGPASSVHRGDVPDRMYEDGAPKIVPLRVATSFSIEPGDPDPRGMKVIAADRHVAGTVFDVWIDQADSLIRYLEVAVPVGGELRRVLFPVTLAHFDGARREVLLSAVLASQFAAAPVTQHPDQVTFREEDKISAYFASGYLYAEPKRLEPII